MYKRVCVKASSCFFHLLALVQCPFWAMLSSRQLSQISVRTVYSWQHVSLRVWYFSFWVVSKANSRKFLESMFDVKSLSRPTNGIGRQMTWLWIRNSHWSWSGMETLMLGGACATVAFTIGYYVNQIVGSDADSVHWSITQRPMASLLIAWSW